MEILQTPLLTVVMITYGHEKYIEEAINGVFMQKTNFPFEFIIANDASTDGTDSVIRKLIQNAPHHITVKYTCHEKNLGMMQNFRWALEQAKGKYIALCEGDDYWIDENKLQMQVDFLEKEPQYSLVFHGSKITVEDAKTYQENLFKNLETREYFDKELLTSWLIPTASAVFRSHHNAIIIQRLKNPKYCFGDIVIFLSLLEAGKMYCLSKKMSVYRINSGGVTQVSQGIKKYSRIYEHQKALANDFDKKYKEHFNPRLRDMEWRIAKYYIKNLNAKGFSYLYKYLFS